MEELTWLKAHAHSLAGKTCAVTGPTGGIGKEICRGILALSGGLILLGRSGEKVRGLASDLAREFPNSSIRWILGDLTEPSDLSQMADSLIAMAPDILVHNAGAYNIPRKICFAGLNNVFTINFAAPYYLTARLLPALAKKQGKVVVMGSVAHTYSPSDENDWDFSSRKPIHLVYGNSKRYLMFGFDSLMDRYPQVDFAIAHPGITVTNITAHYPKALYALIKYPMKLIFMAPGKAARSMILALTEPVPRGCWIGPGIFGVWGNPRIRPLSTCSARERQALCRRSEKIYGRMTEALEASRP